MLERDPEVWDSLFAATLSHLVLSEEVHQRKHGDFKKHIIQGVIFEKLSDFASCPLKV